MVDAAVNAPTGTGSRSQAGPVSTDSEYGGSQGSTVPPAGVRRVRSQFAPFFAVAVGFALALLAVSIGKAHGRWSGLTTVLEPLNAASSARVHNASDARQIDRLVPQNQAETLLEMAVSRNDGAVEQISSRVDRWQGKLKWSPQIATLSTAALNSNDMRVRQSGIEVELAAYGLAKNPNSLNYLLQSAESHDHAKKAWALWALGLIGNRGVETNRVVQVLTDHTNDSDADSRHWAVEGLALVGGNLAVAPLLRSLHDDPSPMVRESAACGLAESGMFTHAQRLSAVPILLNYTDDPALDFQTHAWAFKALNDITEQHLPNDSAVWRSWYENQGSGIGD